MAVNMSELFRGITRNNTGALEQLQTDRQTRTEGVSASDNLGLIKGQTISGTVSSIKNGSVLLTLPDGSNLTARLSEGVEVLPGQNLMFMVEEASRELIALKLLGKDSQLSMMAAKALNAAGINNTAANQSIVNQLLNKNMSIDATTINEMIRGTAKFPQVSQDTIASLIKLNIPLTQNNIEQYEAYLRYEKDFSHQIKGCGETLKSALSELSQNPHKIAKLINTITDNLYGRVEVSVSLDSALKDNKNAFINNLTKAFGEAAGELTDKIAGNQTTVKETMEAVGRLTDNMLQSAGLTDETRLSEFKNHLSGLFMSAGMSELIDAMLGETMYITPQTIARDKGIQDFYKKVRAGLEGISKELEKNEEAPQLKQSFNEVKNNLDFMNDLSKNMTYFQVPLKFSESVGNGEMYVFTNKKSLRSGTDNISALLHLDMDNLGALDVYVKMTGNSINTNFCLEDDETLDFVSSRIDLLDERLQGLGYKTHFEMKVVEKEEQFDFVKEQLKVDDGLSKTSQFLFDIKA